MAKAVDDIAEIKNNLNNEKLVMGTDVTLKHLKLGEVAKVYVTSNCAEDTKDGIRRYAKMNNTPVSFLKVVNTELGLMCKKPFAISVLSLLK